MKRTEIPGNNDKKITTSPLKRRKYDMKIPLDYLFDCFSKRNVRNICQRSCELKGSEEGKYVFWDNDQFLFRMTCKKCEISKIICIICHNFSTKDKWTRKSGGHFDSDHDLECSCTESLENMDGKTLTKHINQSHIAPLGEHLNVESFGCGFVKQKYNECVIGDGEIIFDLKEEKEEKSEEKPEMEDENEKEEVIEELYVSDSDDDDDLVMTDLENFSVKAQKRNEEDLKSNTTEKRNFLRRLRTINANEEKKEEEEIQKMHEEEEIDEEVTEIEYGIDFRVVEDDFVEEVVTKNNMKFTKVDLTLKPTNKTFFKFFHEKCKRRIKECTSSKNADLQSNVSFLDKKYRMENGTPKNFDKDPRIFQNIEIPHRKGFPENTKFKDKQLKFIVPRKDFPKDKDGNLLNFFEDIPVIHRDDYMEPCLDVTKNFGSETKLNFVLREHRKGNTSDREYKEYIDKCFFLDGCPEGKNYVCVHNIPPTYKDFKEFLDDHFKNRATSKFGKNHADDWKTLAPNIPLPKCVYGNTTLSWDVHSECCYSNIVSFIQQTLNNNEHLSHCTWIPSENSEEIFENLTDSIDYNTFFKQCYVDGFVPFIFIYWCDGFNYVRFKPKDGSATIGISKCGNVDLEFFKKERNSSLSSIFFNHYCCYVKNQELLANDIKEYSEFWGYVKSIDSYVRFRLYPYGLRDSPERHAWLQIIKGGAKSITIDSRHLAHHSDRLNTEFEFNLIRNQDQVVEIFSTKKTKYLQYYNQNDRVNGMSKSAIKKFARSWGIKFFQQFSIVVVETKKQKISQRLGETFAPLCPILSVKIPHWSAYNQFSIMDFDHLDLKGMVMPHVKESVAEIDKTLPKPQQNSAPKLEVIVRGHLKEIQNELPSRLRPFTNEDLKRPFESWNNFDTIGTLAYCLPFIFITYFRRYREIVWSLLFHCFVFSCVFRDIPTVRDILSCKEGVKLMCVLIKEHLPDFAKRQKPVMFTFLSCVMFDFVLRGNLKYFLTRYFEMLIKGARKLSNRRNFGSMFDLYEKNILIQNKCALNLENREDFKFSCCGIPFTMKRKDLREVSDQSVIKEIRKDCKFLKEKKKMMDEEEDGEEEEKVIQEDRPHIKINKVYCLKKVKVKKSIFKEGDIVFYVDPRKGGFWYGKLESMYYVCAFNNNNFTPEYEIVCRIKKCVLNDGIMNILDVDEKLYNLDGWTKDWSINRFLPTFSVGNEEMYMNAHFLMNDAFVYSGRINLLYRPFG